MTLFPFLIWLGGCLAARENAPPKALEIDPVYTFNWNGEAGWQDPRTNWGGQQKKPPQEDVLITFRTFSAPEEPAAEQGRLMSAREVRSCDETLKQLYMVGFRSRTYMYPYKTGREFKAVCPNVDYACCSKRELIQLADQFERQRAKFNSLFAEAVAKVTAVFAFRNAILRRDSGGRPGERLRFGDKFREHMELRKPENMWSNPSRSLFHFRRAMDYLRDSVALYHSGFVCSICNGLDQQFYKLGQTADRTDVLVVQHQQSVCHRIFEFYDSIDPLFDALSEFAMVVEVLEKEAGLRETGRLFKATFGDSLTKYSVYREAFAYCKDKFKKNDVSSSRFATCNSLCEKLIGHTVWKDRFRVFRIIDFTHKILSEVESRNGSGLGIDADDDFYLSVRLREDFARRLKFQFLGLKDGKRSRVKVVHQLKVGPGNWNADTGGSGVNLALQPMVLRSEGVLRAAVLALLIGAHF